MRGCEPRRRKSARLCSKTSSLLTVSRITETSSAYSSTLAGRAMYCSSRWRVESGSSAEGAFGSGAAHRGDRQCSMRLSSPFRAAFTTRGKRLAKARTKRSNAGSPSSAEAASPSLACPAAAGNCASAEAAGVLAAAKGGVPAADETAAAAADSRAGSAAAVKGVAAATRRVAATASGAVTAGVAGVRMARAAASMAVLLRVCGRLAEPTGGTGLAPAETGPAAAFSAGAEAAPSAPHSPLSANASHSGAAAAAGAAPAAAAEAAAAAFFAAAASRALASRTHGGTVDHLVSSFGDSASFANSNRAFTSGPTADARDAPTASATSGYASSPSPSAACSAAFSSAAASQSSSSQSSWPSMRSSSLLASHWRRWKRSEAAPDTDGGAALAGC